jgi:hypothetical protein
MIRMPRIQQLLRDRDRYVLPRSSPAALPRYLRRVRAQIVIETLEPLAGDLPARALRLVQEWAGLHRAELEATGRNGGSTTARYD